jgi:hypothetical protein
VRHSLIHSSTHSSVQHSTALGSRDIEIKTKTKQNKTKQKKTPVTAPCGRTGYEVDHWGARWYKSYNGL